MGKVWIFRGFILSFSLYITPAIAQPQIEKNPGHSFGGLTHRFVLFLDGQPWFRPEEEIDRYIGDPERVDERTQRRIQSFVSRVRLELLSGVLSSLDDVENVLDPDTIYRDLRGQEGSYALQMRPSDGSKREIHENLRRTIERHFRDEDWVDLSFYALSEKDVLDSDPDAWKETKRKLILWAFWPATGVVLAQALRNETRLASSGWILESPNQKWRLGWFAKARKLGFSTSNPDYQGGIALRNTNSDWKVSVNSDERLALEVRTFFLRSLGMGDVSTHFRIRSSGKPPSEIDHSPKLEGSIFARRQLSRTSPSPNLVLELRGTKSEVNIHELTLALGLEWTDWMILLRTKPIQNEMTLDREPDFAILAIGSLQPTRKIHP